MSNAETNDSIPAGILLTLKYFGIFSYPLHPAEIHRFHSHSCSLKAVETSLALLNSEGRVTVSPEGFYSLAGGENWSAARKAGNKKALEILARAGRYTRIIKSFPFVEAVAISGSLSKYFAGEDADIDYFIIARRNRLWIARSLLHMFKKLTFLNGSQHCFCMNYFLDEEALELTDKNLYTAIELVTLIPVYNAEKISALKNVNNWTCNFLPNATQEQDLKYLQETRRGLIKKMAEWMLNLLWPEKVNRFLMRFTDQKWRKKWQKKGFPMEEYDQAFFTSLHVSKNHPANFQKRILSALDSGDETHHI